VSELAARPPRNIPGLAAALRDDGYQHCAQADSRDVGGLLVGRLLEEGPPVVEATVRAVEEGSEGGEQGFPYASWDRLHSEIDRRYPGRQIIGWYGGRPGGGTGLTTSDRFIHKSFFTHPGQIAVIIDPHALRAAVYRWRGETLAEHQQLRFTAEARPVARSNAVGALASSQPSAVARAAASARPAVTRRTQAAGGSSRDARRLARTRPPLVTALYVIAIVISLAAIVWVLLLR
jgi:hypothetical protein